MSRRRSRNRRTWRRSLKLYAPARGVWILSLILFLLGLLSASADVGPMDPQLALYAPLLSAALLLLGTAIRTGGDR